MTPPPAGPLCSICRKPVKVTKTGLVMAHGRGRMGETCPGKSLPFITAGQGTLPLRLST